ncbi:MAG TPA: hypothetical protein VFZ48_03205 [Candidatus Saccharimonadales bacterium]
MKIATKTLATLLIVTVLSISTISGVSALQPGTDSKKNNFRLERLQRHDRKFELRASVLGLTGNELKQELKQRTFDQVLKRHGFKDREAFQKALAGKLKDELKRRGWSERKIQRFLDRRAARLAH